MSLFHFCWYADWLIALIAVYFFITGISTATPGSNFGSTWAVLFLILFVVLGGSYWLHANGYNRLAMILAGIPAGAGLLYVLFLLVAVFSGARWN